MMIKIIIAGIVVAIVIWKIVSEKRDAEMVKTMSEERIAARQQAIKEFGTDEHYDGRVEPPVIYVWTGCNYDKPGFDCDTMETVNYYSLYKFINGKWKFEQKLVKHGMLVFPSLNTCKDYGCSMISNYFHFDKNAKKVKTR